MRGFQETLKARDETSIGVSGYDVEYCMDVNGIYRLHGLFLSRKQN